MAETHWHAHPLPAPPDADLELVWLHGWGQTGNSLLRLAGLFAARARSLAFDLPGFGATPPLGEGAGSADYADALAAQLGSVGRRIVVGHSFGARVAVQLAARHPDLVDGLVLIAGAGLRRRRSVVWRMRAGALKGLGRTARMLDRRLGTGLYARFAARFGSADYRAAGPLRGTLVAVVGEDLSAVAEQVEVPVLLIYGSDDSETPPELGERYAALMPYAELHVLDGFGHLDILSRGAYQCQNLINRFVDRIL